MWGMSRIVIMIAKLKDIKLREPVHRAYIAYTAYIEIHTPRT